MSINYHDGHDWKDAYKRPPLRRPVDGGSSGSAANADWAQNDPTKPGYVKNRTHNAYNETVSYELSEQPTIEVDLPAAGETFECTIDGEKSEFVVSEETLEDGGLTGVLRWIGDNPFDVYEDVTENLTYGWSVGKLEISDGTVEYLAVSWDPHTITLEQTLYNRISRNFLPEGIVIASEPVNVAPIVLPAQIGPEVKCISGRLHLSVDVPTHSNIIYDPEDSDPEYEADFDSLAVGETTSFELLTHGSGEGALRTMTFVFNTPSDGSSVTRISVAFTSYVNGLGNVPTTLLPVAEKLFSVSITGRTRVDTDDGIKFRATFVVRRFI